MDNLEIDKINEAIDMSKQAAERLTSISEYYELEQNVAKNIEENKENIEQFNKSALMQIEKMDQFNKNILILVEKNEQFNNKIFMELKKIDSMHKEFQEYIKQITIDNIAIKKNIRVIIIILIINLIINIANIFL